MLNRFRRIINKPVISQAVLAVIVLQCKTDSQEISIHLLCCEAVLVVLDGREPANELHPAGYFSALATISNQWRDVSMGQKIRDTAHSLGGLTASGQVRSAPPRALRGRWGSIAAIEKAILRAGKCLAIVFLAMCFTKPLASGARSVARVGAEETAAYNAEQTMYKSNIVKLMNSKPNMPMVFVASTCKRVLTHTLLWGQKPY